jgi:hypothetical protein
MRKALDSLGDIASLGDNEQVRRTYGLIGTKAWRTAESSSLLGPVRPSP